MYQEENFCRVKCMKRTAIITIAGMSTRFSKSCGSDIHKAIYSDEKNNWTTLSHQLNLVKDSCDEIIIVTGHKHEDIKKYLDINFKNLPLKLVYNDHYFDYGSCYSLILGVEAVSESADEVIFLEGDLIFDTKSFNKLVNIHKNVITANNELIDARTAVIFYINDKKKINYLYDTTHTILRVNEPFLIMGNSGQVWKFIYTKRLKTNLKNYGIQEYKGTNLVPINDYYKETSFDELEIVTFKEWFNCNTINDYKKMKTYIEKEKQNGYFE